ncbi:hypothetical protein [Merismopedia glauca]|uniref:hypothetical protein n=1 Tax=Merismopedia glauca TaxID=292586 RepID=UPI0015E74EC7|nr:hypothetical protein [Merismopedia glauca]
MYLSGKNGGCDRITKTDNRSHNYLNNLGDRITKTEKRSLSLNLKDQCDRHLCI